MFNPNEDSNDLISLADSVYYMWDLSAGEPKVDIVSSNIYLLILYFLSPCDLFPFCFSRRRVNVLWNLKEIQSLHLVDGTLTMDPHR